MNVTLCVIVMKDILEIQLSRTQVFLELNLMDLITNLKSSLQISVLSMKITTLIIRYNFKLVQLIVFGFLFFGQVLYFAGNVRRFTKINFCSNPYAFLAAPCIQEIDPRKSTWGGLSSQINYVTGFFFHLLFPYCHLCNSSWCTFECLFLV